MEISAFFFRHSPSYLRFSFVQAKNALQIARNISKRTCQIQNWKLKQYSIKFQLFSEKNRRIVVYPPRGLIVEHTDDNECLFTIAFLIQPMKSSKSESYRQEPKSLSAFLRARQSSPISFAEPPNHLLRQTRGSPLIYGTRCLDTIPRSMSTSPRLMNLREHTSSALNRPLIHCRRRLWITKSWESNYSNGKFLHYELVM